MTIVVPLHFYMNVIFWVQAATEDMSWFHQTIATIFQNSHGTKMAFKVNRIQG